MVKLRDIEKNKEVLKRLVKSEEEKFPDLEKMREERNAEEARVRKEKMKAEQKEKEIQEMQWKEEKMKWVTAVDDYNDEENMKSNKEYNEEEDFL